MPLIDCEIVIVMAIHVSCVDSNYAYFPHLVCRWILFQNLSALKHNTILEETPAIAPPRSIS